MDPRAHLTRRGRLFYKTDTYSNIWPPELATEGKKGIQTIVSASPANIAALLSNDIFILIHFWGAVLSYMKCGTDNGNLLVK